MPYSPIQCHLYDYIEIACMRHYHLDVELKSGEHLIGYAQNTQVKNKEEFLVFLISGVIQLIRLDKIKRITALDSNAEFSSVIIN